MGMSGKDNRQKKISVSSEITSVNKVRELRAKKFEIIQILGVKLYRLGDVNVDRCVNAKQRDFLNQSLRMTPSRTVVKQSALHTF